MDYFLALPADEVPNSYPDTTGFTPSKGLLDEVGYAVLLKVSRQDDGQQWPKQAAP